LFSLKIHRGILSGIERNRRDISDGHRGTRKSPIGIHPVGDVHDTKGGGSSRPRALALSPSKGKRRFSERSKVSGVEEKGIVPCAAGFCAAGSSACKMLKAQEKSRQPTILYPFEFHIHSPFIQSAANFLKLQFFAPFSSINCKVSGANTSSDVNFCR